MLDNSSQSERMQRARGVAKVTFGPDGLRHLYQSGCAKALMPRSYGPIPQAVFINTSGGITGGDKLSFTAGVEQGAQLTVTTQAAERIYKSSGALAEVNNTVNVARDGKLEWLPQETILFDGAALKRNLNVEIATGGRFLGVETLVLGRKAMGETLENISLADHWRIKREGKMIFADTTRLETEYMARLSSNATLNSNRAMAMLIYIGPDACDRITDVRSLLPTENIEAAASAWNGILSVRFLAPDAQPLRAALTLFLEQFRKQSLPRNWYM